MFTLSKLIYPKSLSPFTFPLRRGDGTLASKSAQAPTFRHFIMFIHEIAHPTKVNPCMLANKSLLLGHGSAFSLVKEVEFNLEM